MTLDGNTVDTARFRLVRTDTYNEVPGKIVYADEESGECRMLVAGETKPLSFGPYGIKILRR